MAVYFVSPTPTEEHPTPADSGDYTYDLRPAPMRQEARIADMERQIAMLATRIAILEEPQRTHTRIMAALFGDGRIEA